MGRMKKKAHKDPLAAHRTMDSITGDGFLRRELALALKSERGNRGRRMDLVLGIGDSQEDESDFESGSEGPQEPGQGGSLHREGSIRFDSKDGVSPVRVVSRALKAAETLAKKEASRMKTERMMSLEADTSHKRKVTTSSSAGSDQKNYLVNIEDLSVKSVVSKENSIPTFNTQRGALPTKANANDPTAKQTAGKAKHSQFMAKYGLQKYVKLFKPV